MCWHTIRDRLTWLAYRLEFGYIRKVLVVIDRFTGFVIEHTIFHNELQVFKVNGHRFPVKGRRIGVVDVYGNAGFVVCEIIKYRIGVLAGRVQFVIQCKCSPGAFGQGYISVGIGKAIILFTCGIKDR